MGACDGSVGQWWWFPLAFGSGALAVVLVGVTVGLWSGVLSSPAPVDEEPATAGWRGFVRDRGAALLGLLVWAWLLVSAARRGDWQLVWAGSAMAVAVVVGAPALERALRPAVALGDLRLAALAEARTLTSAEQARVTRARWATSAALAACALVCVASFALAAASMVEVPCPE